MQVTLAWSVIIFCLKAKDVHYNSKLHFICITNFISFRFDIPLSIIVLFLDLSCSKYTACSITCLLY